jgi:ABC-type bacteriocin/lantibiotic exporter with double-glycine peptidase domain
VAWHGEAKNPVALIRRGSRHYVMFDTKTGTQRPVDRSVAMELAPEAASFYPALPARPLRFRDLLTFSFQHATGNFLRIAIAVVVIGLLSLVTPLITNVLINSVIPRSELDQLAFLCARPCRHGHRNRRVQTMQGLTMLRVEGT